MINIYFKNPMKNLKVPIKNAFNTSYSMKAKELFTASFSLPADDAWVDKLDQLDFIEVYDGPKRIELFIIVESKETFNNGVAIVTYDLFDALYLLNFSVMNDYHQLVNPTTVSSLNYVLNQQAVPDWKLGTCEFSRGFSYSWENENGLINPLFSIPNEFGEDYEFVRNTTSYPFTISLKRPNSKVNARVKQGYNMRGFEIKRVGKNIVNSIIPKGNAEGVNTVDIKRYSKGSIYIQDKPSMVKYRPAWYIWKDERYTIEENLYSAALSKLNAWKQPKITWTVTATDLTKVLRHPSNVAANRNREIKVNELNYMDVVQIETKKYGKIELRITERGKSDVGGNPGELNLTMTNEEPGADQADYARQQEIAKMTAMGAQSFIPFVFDREADPDKPVEFSFRVPEEAVNVNNAFLSINTTAFRATSKANTTAPQQVQSSTSSAGGAYVSSTTSASGGGYAGGSTSSAGGSAQVGTTSSAGGDHRHRMFVGYDPGPVEWKEYVFSAYNQAVVSLNMSSYSASKSELYTEGSSGSHNHTVNVNIPGHTHNVQISIPSHSHGVSINIPNHTHQVSITIPAHTHDIVYGIFEYSKRANSLEVWIDGNKASINSTNVTDFDLKDLMKKDGSGKITRGNHTLKIKPNELARLEIQLMLIVFIKSRIGEKL
ncbi:phage tail spike protein [Enterococcus sp. LJL99]